MGPRSRPGFPVPRQTGGAIFNHPWGDAYQPSHSKSGVLFPRWRPQLLRSVLQTLGLMGAQAGLTCSTVAYLEPGLGEMQTQTAALPLSWGMEASSRRTGQGSLVCLQRAINKPGVRGFADCSIKGRLGCLVSSLTEASFRSSYPPTPQKA